MRRSSGVHYRIGTRLPKYWRVDFEFGANLLNIPFGTKEK